MAEAVLNKVVEAAVVTMGDEEITRAHHLLIMPMVATRPTKLIRILLHIPRLPTPLRLDIRTSISSGPRIPSRVTTTRMRLSRCPAQTITLIMRRNHMLRLASTSRRSRRRERNSRILLPSSTAQHTLRHRNQIFLTGEPLIRVLNHLTAVHGLAADIVIAEDQGVVMERHAQDNLLTNMSKCLLLSSTAVIASPIPQILG